MYGYNGFGQTPGQQTGTQIDQAAGALLALIMNGPGSSTDNQTAAAQSLAQLDPAVRQQVCASMSTLAAQQADTTVQSRVNAVCVQANNPGGAPSATTAASTWWWLAAAAAGVGVIYLVAKKG